MVQLIFRAGLTRFGSFLGVSALVASPATPHRQGGARRFFRGAHIAMSEVVASRFVSFGMAEALV